MTKEVKDLCDTLADVVYMLNKVSAAIAAIAEMYPLPYAEDDHAAMARMADRLGDSVFRFNVRFKVFTTKMARDGQ